METKVLDIKGKEKGTCALPESLFAVKANPTFLHEVVTAFLANQRSGTADVKTRSEVSHLCGNAAESNTALRLSR